MTDDPPRIGDVYYIPVLTVIRTNQRVAYTVEAVNNTAGIALMKQHRGKNRRALAFEELASKGIRVGRVGWFGRIKRDAA